MGVGWDSIDRVIPIVDALVQGLGNAGSERQEVEKLLQEADRWRRVQNLRSYLAAVREALGSVAEGGDVGRWLDWAEAVAERIDPLRVVERVARGCEEGGATTTKAGLRKPFTDYE